jgi:hypothetical protein
MKDGLATKLFFFVMKPNWMQLNEVKQEMRKTIGANNFFVFSFSNKLQ